MANHRRNFIKTMATMGFAYPLSSLAVQTETAVNNDFPSLEKLKDLWHTEDNFWQAIQDSYHQTSAFINLENGYLSPQPLSVLYAYTEHSRAINAAPAHYMRTRQFEDKEDIRTQLAFFAGTLAEETAITRNTTESLNILIHGLPLKSGDEIVISNQDYGSMVEAFNQRAQRNGIVVKTIDIPLHPKSDDEVVTAYSSAFTKKTKLVLVTHMINTTGQILPVKKIAQEAHSKNIEVMVDGAHTFAHINFTIPDLECDYYAASLHKWLCNPIGAGILWVKKEKIEKIWPLMGDTSQPKDNIRKFEHYGTNPCAVQLTLPHSIKFTNIIGLERKEKRLRYLKNYWVDKLKPIKGIGFNTPADDNRTGAIANVWIEGQTPSQVAKILMDKYNIFTVAIKTKAVNGVRITPHLYTTENQLDKLVVALTEIAKT